MKPPAPPPAEEAVEAEEDAAREHPPATHTDEDAVWARTQAELDEEAREDAEMEARIQRWEEEHPAGSELQARALQEVDEQEAWTREHPPVTHTDEDAVWTRTLEELDEEAREDAEMEARLRGGSAAAPKASSSAPRSGTGQVLAFRPATRPAEPEAPPEEGSTAPEEGSTPAEPPGGGAKVVSLTDRLRGVMWIVPVLTMAAALLLGLRGLWRPPPPAPDPIASHQPPPPSSGDSDRPPSLGPGKVANGCPGGHCDDRDLPPPVDSQKQPAPDSSGAYGLRCTTGFDLPPPPTTSQQQTALWNLQAAYRTLHLGKHDEVEQVATKMLDDQDWFGRDDLEEPREAYLLAAMRCLVTMGPEAQQAELNEKLRERARALLVRFPKGVYSKAVARMLSL